MDNQGDWPLCELKNKLTQCYRHVHGRAIGSINCPSLLWAAWELRVYFCTSETDWSSWAHLGVGVCQLSASWD